jgi:hypothetical protein
MPFLIPSCRTKTEYTLKSNSPQICIAFQAFVVATPLAVRFILPGNVLTRQLGTSLLNVKMLFATPGANHHRY